MTASSWVELVKVGALPPTLVSDLREDLEAYLHCDVRIGGFLLDPESAFDPERRQYSALAILEGLLEPPLAPGGRRFAVTSRDLFLPVFTHVFGTAQLQGSVGVASIYRLRPEFSGAPRHSGLLRDRLLKEVLHELGHTLGLVHCRFPWCAMAVSRLPEHIDLKDPGFCDACTQLLQTPVAVESAPRAG